MITIITIIMTAILIPISTILALDIIVMTISNILFHSIITFETSILGGGMFFGILQLDLGFWEIKGLGLGVLGN